MYPKQVTPMRVLHLVGSSVSDFYYQLSLVYAKAALQPVGVHHTYAVVHPEGFWQVGTSLASLSEKLSLQEMLSQLPKVDLVVPYMFCLPGMTTFRAFFEDILGVPVVGSPSMCTAVAANKAQTRSIVSSAGVHVAQGQQLRKGDRLTMQPPFVVKPNAEDNSLGVTLVFQKEQIDEALQTAFEFDDTILVEAYIPGRELRVAVIEREGQLYIPAMIEYLVTEEHPIRTVQDKLKLSAVGTPERQPDQPPATPVCPAHVTPELFAQLADAAKKAHVALGCRDYSLFDFRVHAETGTPYMLEAGLFWTFGEISMISRMILADGEAVEEIVLEVWNRAAQRVRVASGSLFKYT